MNNIYSTIKQNTKKSKKKLWLIIALVVALAIIAFFVLTRFGKSEAHYITQNPVRGDISQDVSATGTLEPTDTVEVGSQISGTIYEVLVDVNDEVKKGQILAKIDPEKLDQAVDNFEAQLQSAKAELTSAQVALENKKWTYENYKDLFEKTDGKSPSQLQLKTAELEYKSALANIDIRKASIRQLETSLKSAKIDVKNAIITSPTNGIVLVRSIDPGQTVAASFSTPTLFTIAQDLTKMKLISSVLEADVGKVKVGQEVEFSVDAYPNEKFIAKVAKVNFADSSSTSGTNSSTSTSSNIISYEVTTFVDNSKLLLRPGMSATATIKTASVKNALIIPYQALLFSPNQAQSKKGNGGGMPMMGPPKHNKRSYSGISNKGSVWILENGVPKQVEVDIGITNGKSAQVLGKNLSLDSQVIIQKDESKK